jgi:ribosomal protein S18 acetylase RimI-like enzyme
MHKTNLDKSFLGSLGVGFLNILYQTLIIYPGGLLIVAEENDQLAGFVSGVDHIRKFYKFFICKKIFSTIFTILPKLISLNNLKKILETSNYGGHETRVDLPNAELLSIAVNEEYRGQGISAQLFEQLCKSFSSKGITEFKIVVGVELLPARKFYSKIGCVEVSSVQVHQGLESKNLTYSIMNNEV